MRSRLLLLLLLFCCLKTADAFLLGLLDAIKSFLCLIPILNLFLDCNPEVPEEEVEEKENANIPITNNGLYPVPLLDLPLELLNPTMVVGSSDPELLNELIAAAQQAPLGDYSFSVFLGLNKGEGALTFQLDTANPNYLELLGYPEFGITADSDGIYSADTLLIIDHESREDNIYRWLSLDPIQILDEKGKDPTGGCCSILAVAHSLVRKMGGIVTQASAVNGTFWDPCFLWRVWAASGDGDYPDGGRGLSDGEGEDGHTANWNDAWRVRQIDDNEPLFDEDDDLTCEELEKRCKKLEARVEDTNDDVTMRLRGKDGKKGDEWGHRVPVESVTYTAGPPCKCDITITQTSVQDPGNNSFEGIPFNPGTATYTITASDSGADTTVSNTEFPTSTITKMEFDSFDEEPRNSNVRSTDQGNKGTAFTDVECPPYPNAD